MKSKYKEHIASMEKHLGFKIPKGMVVHHKDENPFNNDIDNLELLLNKPAHAERHRQMRASKAGFPISYKRCSKCDTWHKPGYIHPS